MKKAAFIIGFALLAIQGLQAQLTPPQPIKKTPVIKTQTSPGLESQPTRPQAPAPAINNASYFLSTVKVTIGTGSDNKESLSNVSIELAARDAGFQIFAQNDNTNEFKSNNSVTVGLDKSSSFTSSSNKNIIPTAYYSSATGTKSISLKDIETYGLSLRIIYKPNFFADAWKIETVTITLEFKDAGNKLHPNSGQKTITFSNAATFLDNFDKRILICTADGSFNPLTSFVTKDFSKRW